MTETAYPQPTADEIPNTMTAREQWLCWREEERDGKPTKVPINPTDGKWGSTTNPETWSSFDIAYECATEYDYGLGFVFTEIDPLVGIDLDDCRDAESGRPTPVAKEIVGALDSYTEVSPSGEGYHVILQGRLPSARNRRGKVEMYEKKRFFTVTGDHVEGTPRSAKERHDELDEVYDEHIGVGTTVGGNEQASRQSSTPALSDSELIRRAGAAKNGEKFQRLWQGQTTGYASQSEADMALCCLLAFWTGGDAKRIDSLFRDSGLIREKWDEQHYSDGSTYGEVTVKRAVDVADEFYEPGGNERVAGGRGESSSISPDPQPSGQRAYDAERIRLLEQRVQELEVLVGLKEERIRTLEAEVANHQRPPLEVDPDGGNPAPDSEDSRSLLQRFFS
jgi:primase-polymerase (primpol)-like protein